jgi:serpin B
MRTLAVLVLVVALGCMPVAAPGASPTPERLTTPGAPATDTPAPATAPGEPASPIAQAGEILEASSELLRNPPEAASDSEFAQVVTADRAFAFDLYRILGDTEPGNIFLSPYSISTALSMVLAGARGQTYEELAEALGVVPDRDAWHRARNRLELELTALGQQELPGDRDATPLTLEPTNAIFGQAGYPFKQAFLDTLAGNYGAAMRAVDFGGEPEPSRQAINQWVADRTNDRIEELIAPDLIDPNTRAVLVNAIFFKASWLYRFDPAHTETGPFHLLDGSTVAVEMMGRRAKTGYADGDGWQAIELPYVGEASMVVIVPDEGNFADVDGRLDDDFLADVMADLEEHDVELRLPRWESESTLDLIPPLQSLGVESLFDDADLTGMADAGLFVSFITHQANITVDEEGTEAAAATAVGVAESAAPPATLTVDRPFIYLIRDSVAGEILFLGRLVEPS